MTSKLRITNPGTTSFFAVTDEGKSVNRNITPPKQNKNI
jgi:hypothetical protein